MAADYPMTPKRRFLAGILGGRVDQPPMGSLTSVVDVEHIEITGSYIPDRHENGDKMARLAAGAYEILGYDAIMPYFSIRAVRGCSICDVYP